MKNKIILILCFIGLLIFVISSKNSKINPFVEETKVDIKNLESEKEELFEWADKTMQEVEQQKLDREHEIYVLDSIINKNKRTLNNSNLNLAKNKKINDSLKKENAKYIQQKEALEVLLEQVKSSLKEVKEMNEEKAELLKEIYAEKEMLQQEYDYLNSIYQDSKFTVVDTVYQIDTLFYNKEDVKKIKIKSN
jgi:chromosome segregation ATPase